MAEKTKPLTDAQIRSLFKRQTDKILELGMDVLTLQNLLILKGLATESEIHLALQKSHAQGKAALDTIARREPKSVQ